MQIFFFRARFYGASDETLNSDRKATCARCQLTKRHDRPLGWRNSRTTRIRTITHESECSERAKNCEGRFCLRV